MEFHYNRSDFPPADVFLQENEIKEIEKSGWTKKKVSVNIFKKKSRVEKNTEIHTHLTRAHAIEVVLYILLEGP